MAPPRRLAGSRRRRSPPRLPGFPFPPFPSFRRSLDPERVAEPPMPLRAAPLVPAFPGQTGAVPHAPIVLASAGFGTAHAPGAACPAASGMRTGRRRPVAARHS